ncbi:hypermethylated in cancer 2 protein-like isoform X1 [Periophthalmus magnuspinnatus]|uniref:hypermethylated in cancer 2 protein-like isoform X1 n=1 Tax=Periophthalmus magnuspinnatus TaxID=409849 RepID=UPI00145B7AF8|nr:hypermethylated in cancer 2 protein-like isoform X1 [Periophthalmus magnuspinnatus]
MRLEKHTAVVAFHSQLSAILEKLMVLAVEEIKELVFDFCEEISQEKTQNKDLYERTREDQGESVYHSSDSFYIETQDDHNEPQDQMSPTNSREDAKEKLFPNTFSNHDPENMPTNCKFEQVATVSKNPSTIEQKEDCSHEESRQSNFEPPEDNKKHLIDYNSPDESQCTTYDEDISTNQDHSRDVEFHIKQEEETPGFETGRHIDLYNSNVEQGIHFDSYDTRPEETLPSTLDNAGPMLGIPPFSLPDQQMNAYIFNPEKQYAVHPELSLPPSKQVKKYECDFCNKKFCYPSDLKHHRLWHTRERKHVCQICGKAFITRSHLRRHELMHLDVQPSVCQICGYRTSRMVYLKEHMKTHNKKTHE